MIMSWVVHNSCQLRKLTAYHCNLMLTYSWMHACSQHVLYRYQTSTVTQQCTVIQHCGCCGFHHSTCCVGPPQQMPPRDFEPASRWLTAICSTTQLLKMYSLCLWQKTFIITSFLHRCNGSSSYSMQCHKTTEQGSCIQ